MRDYNPNELFKHATGKTLKEAYEHACKLENREILRRAEEIKRTGKINDYKNAKIDK